MHSINRTLADNLRAWGQDAGFPQDYDMPHVKAKLLAAADLLETKQTDKDEPKCP